MPNPSSGGPIYRPWLEVPLVTSFISGLPALGAATIFTMSVQKPLTERIAPELVQFHQTLATRLELTAPLTIGVALIALMWLKRTPDVFGLRVLLSTGALLLTTWLGKTLAFGLTASARTDAGHFVVVEGNRLVWQSDQTAVVTNALAESYWTHGIALLVNYFRLYGPLQFGFSIVCGLFLGGYWAYRLRSIF